MSNKQVDRHITFFQVGNGNSALIWLGSDVYVLFDLNDTEDYFPVLEYLKKILPKKGKKPYLAAYCASHGDQDHIRGAARLLKDFLVGEIWYPNYDRFEMEGEEQSDDDDALYGEIERGREALANGSKEPGDLAYDLTAMDYADSVHGSQVKDFGVKVLSPYCKDEGEENFDINDMSLVLNLELNGMRWLFAGDASAKSWLERINTHLLAKEDYKDWAKADVLMAAHHGSYTFFDMDRETARDNPSNYVSLKKKIMPSRILVSSNERFPMKDQEKQQPPHYAAYKSYKKYLVDAGLCSKDNDHPFLYTCDGSVRFELCDGK